MLFANMTGLLLCVLSLKMQDQFSKKGSIGKYEFSKYTKYGRVGSNGKRFTLLQLLFILNP